MIDLEVDRQRRIDQNRRALLPDPIVVPRRKPLPPQVPLATGPSLLERISLHPDAPPPVRKPLIERIADKPPISLPVGHRPIDLDFQKKSPQEVSAIFDRRVDATVNRLFAIWDVKDLYEQLPAAQRQALNKLGAKLNWLQQNVDKAGSWEKKDQDSLKWGLKQIGEVSFQRLHQNYTRAVAQLTFIYDSGYFDWINVE